MDKKPTIVDVCMALLAKNSHGSESVDGLWCWKIDPNNFKKELTELTKLVKSPYYEKNAK